MPKIQILPVHPGRHRIRHFGEITQNQGGGKIFANSVISRQMTPWSQRLATRMPMPRYS